MRVNFAACHLHLVSCVLLFSSKNFYDVEICTQRTGKLQTQKLDVLVR